MKVVVVGAGVIGLWCALALLREGAEVVVIDRGDRAMATPAAAGWVVPALSAPLAGPGVIRQTGYQILRREAAFGFRPSMSPTMLRWVSGFVASAAEHRYRQGIRAILALAAPAIPAYQELHRAHVPFEMHDRGLLLAARTEAGMGQALGLLDDSAAAGYEGRYRVLDCAAAQDLEPALSREVVGAVHAESEVWVRPEDLLTALTKSIVELGGTIVGGAPVDDIIPALGGRWSVRSGHDLFSADRVVCAAGAWTGGLLRSLGLRVPLLPAAGYSITSTGIGISPSHALKLIEPNIALAPFDDGVRIAGRFDLGRSARHVPQRRMRVVLRRTEPYLASWRSSVVSAAYAGLRPATPDSLPLIGPVPGSDGVFVATGHGMLGLTLAPGTADEIRRLVLHGAGSEVGTAFRLDRYLDGRH
jgi:D-amino-acid dehydrogenase